MAAIKRFGGSLMSKFGKATNKETSDTDVVLEKWKENAVLAHRNCVALRKMISKLILAQKEVCEFEEKVNQFILSMYENEWPERTIMEEKMRSIEEGRKSALNRFGNCSGLTNLDSYICDYEPIKNQIKLHKQKLGVYKTLKSNYESMEKGNNGGDDVKYKKVYQEYQDAERVLNIYTSKLKVEVPNYYNKRLQIFSDACEELFQCLVSIHGENTHNYKIILKIFTAFQDEVRRGNYCTSLASKHAMIASNMAAANEALLNEIEDTYDVVHEMPQNHFTKNAEDAKKIKKEEKKSLSRKEKAAGLNESDKVEDLKSQKRKPTKDRPLPSDISANGEINCESRLSSSLNSTVRVDESEIRGKEKCGKNELEKNKVDENHKFVINELLRSHDTAASSIRTVATKQLEVDASIQFLEEDNYAAVDMSKKVKKVSDEPTPKERKSTVNKSPQIPSKSMLKVENDSISEVDTELAKMKSTRFKVTMRYEAQSEKELSLETGEMLNAMMFNENEDSTNFDDKNWLFGFKDSDGKNGYFPRKNCVIINDDE